jgi:alpha-amylase/alpha-mannosidase (GH57 family)
MAARRKPKGRLPVGILWHQHQPFYRTRLGGDPKDAYLLPWVRLHAVRDYFPMAALLAEFPGVHATINLVPSLVSQLEEYTEGGATDRWMELSLKPASSLTPLERDFLIARFFDADWDNEVRVHPRYAELLELRLNRIAFRDRDIADLQMWFNLAWFPPEARNGRMALEDGKHVSVRDFVSKGQGFTRDDIEEVLDRQLAVMRNVVPIHRRLMESGQVEISVTPFYHPILPILVDSDRATVDADGAELPPRFSYPEDARAQIERAVSFYSERFGRAPRGMWPSEGSVGEHVVPLVADAGFTWMATDRGVLEKSGEWGFETEDPDVLLRPYTAGSGSKRVSVFFRHTRLSDDIGFTLQDYSDYDHAAEEYLSWMRQGFADRVDDRGDHILSIILDGENCWGAYRNAGRAFLRGLYRRLEDDPDLVAVTFSDYIEGDAARGVRPHPQEEQHEVSPLYTASWIDEMGSPHGNDLNIWIGSPEENRAWELLGRARAKLQEAGATPESHPRAFDSLYVAEGSDWFWWFGDDFVLAPGIDQAFDWLFRERLRDIYRELGEEPPPELDEPIRRRFVVWTREEPIECVRPGRAIRFIVGRPGTLVWTTDGWKTRHETPLTAIGDVMALHAGYAATIGPFDASCRRVGFGFRWRDATRVARRRSINVADENGCFD